MQRPSKANHLLNQGCIEHCWTMTLCIPQQVKKYAKSENKSKLGVSQLNSAMPIPH